MYEQITKNFDSYFQSFLQSDLGKIYIAIPWDEWVSVFNIKETVKDTNIFFSPRSSKLALTFLKLF